MLRTIATHFVTLTFLCGIVYLLSSCVLSLLIYFTAFCSFLYISFLLATVVDNILPRFRVNADKRAVFITGKFFVFILMIKKIIIMASK